MFVCVCVYVSIIISVSIRCVSFQKECVINSPICFISSLVKEFRGVEGVSLYPLQLYPNCSHLVSQGYLPLQASLITCWLSQSLTLPKADRESGVHNSDTTLRAFRFDYDMAVMCGCINRILTPDLTKLFMIIRDVALPRNLLA